MSSAEETRRRDLEHLTRAGSFATGPFLVVTWLTTQVASIRAALPFTEDPYDAVVSFAVIAIAVVGMATLVRAIGQLRRPYQPSVERRIAIGMAIATVVVAVAVVSDVLALIAAPIDVAVPGVALVLVLLGITAASALVALACIVRAGAALRDAPAPGDTEPDVLDQLGLIAASVGAVHTADGLAGWMERSPLSPRRHRILVGLLGGAAAGIGAIAWHAVREGPWASPVAAAIFGSLMAFGVTGAYLVCLTPLRLLRTPRRN